jgi:hypothetical protein
MRSSKELGSRKAALKSSTEESFGIKLKRLRLL